MTTAHTTLMDGVNRHIQVLAPALSRQENVELTVLTCLPPGDLNSSLSGDGVRTVSLNAPSIRAAVCFWRLLVFLLKERPDVVHVETPVIFVYAAVAALRLFGLKIRIIETIHGIGDPSARKALSFRDRVYRFFRARHDGYIFISKGVYDARKGMAGIEDYIYNPMSFDEDRLLPKGALHKALDLDGSIPIIGTACRIAAVKQPVQFVRAMIRVLEKNPNAHAAVIGDGTASLMDEIRREAGQSSVSDRIHFLGSRIDAKALIADMACFVLTSAREGMPTALLEAMSQKVPVAFWKGEGGLRDLAEMGESGAALAVVREQGDVAGLAEGIVEVLNDPTKAKEMAERAFAVGKKTFDLEKIAKQTVDFYLKVEKLHGKGLPPCRC